MFRRMQRGLLALALLAGVLAAEPAHGGDILGIYTDSAGTGGSYLDISTGSATVYLVLTDISRPCGICGWECRLDGDWDTNTNISYIGDTLHGPQSINVYAFPEYGVGMDCLGQDPNGNIWLASWTFLFLAPETMHLYLGPCNNPMIPGLMVYLDSDNVDMLWPMYPSSGSFDLPVFGFNPVPAQSTSFGQLKACYR
jgi:hypothetical protein